MDTPGNGAGAGATATTQTPVTALAPDPTVSVGCQGEETGDDVTVGATASVCVDVGDDADGGSVTDPVTVSVPAPAGLTPESADGQGWSCGDHASFYGFVCVRAGDDLNPGQQYPVIDTSWKVNGGLTGTVPVHATCYTANQRRLSGAQATSSVTENAPAPVGPRSSVSTGAAAAASSPPRRS